MENIDLHVVIADSNVQDRESKKKIMEGMGMKVVLSTGDGSKALETIKQKRVDVVVMDMILPGVDGIGILEEVNNSNQKKQAHIYRRNSPAYGKSSGTGNPEWCRLLHDETCFRADAD